MHLLVQWHYWSQFSSCSNNTSQKKKAGKKVVQRRTYAMSIHTDEGGAHLQRQAKLTLIR